MSEAEAITHHLVCDLLNIVQYSLRKKWMLKLEIIHVYDYNLKVQKVNL